MPMDIERYEEIMSKLNDPELSHTERSELLQELRQDYTQVHEDFKTLTETREKLEAEKNDLLIANSKMFRQLSIHTDEQTDDEEEQKEFSETITIEQLEQNALNN